MSTTTPVSRRRRIAGERTAQRPVSEPVEDLAPPSEDPPAAPADRGPGRAVRLWVLAGLAVVALLLVCLAAGPFVPGLGLGAVRDARTQQGVEEARRTAPAAAERAALTILAYDYRDLEADRDAAAALMTPGYRADYLETFDGTVLEAAADVKARVSAEVGASGTALAEPDRAEVLLFVNQTTMSTANPDPQVALNRVMLTLERQGDGTWLVDDITSY